MVRAILEGHKTVTRRLVKPTSWRRSPNARGLVSRSKTYEQKLSRTKPILPATSARH